mmetsp:Transcript_5960/g.15178  ORF Transcript_5960/g.15178 Transcript_5960/m.15178 type:complete len:217 (-) Transcript_5960:436-1086(-)
MLQRDAHHGRPDMLRRVLRGGWVGRGVAREQELDADVRQHPHRVGAAAPVGSLQRPHAWPHEPGHGVAGDHSRGRADARAGVRQEDHARPREGQLAAVHAAARKHDGECHGSHSHVESDGRHRRPGDLHVGHRHLWRDHAAGCVLAPRSLYRRQHCVDRQDLHDTHVRSGISHLHCLGSGPGPRHWTGVLARRAAQAHSHSHREPGRPGRVRVEPG